MGNLGIIASMLQPSAAQAWSPLDLPDLVAWYDASDLSSITQSGGRVSAWADLSGNGYTVASAGARQPVTGAVTIGERNALNFDAPGGSYNLDGSAASSQPFTVYSVLHVPHLDGWPNLFDVHDTPNGASIWWYGADVYMSAPTDANVGYAVDSSHDYDFVAVFNGDASRFFVNGVQIGTTFSAGSNPLASLRLGRNHQDDNGMGLYIGEFAVQGGEPSDADLDGWSTYRTRWGF